MKEQKLLRHHSYDKWLITQGKMRNNFCWCLMQCLTLLDQIHYILVVVLAYKKKKKKKSELYNAWILLAIISILSLIRIWRERSKLETYMTQWNAWQWRHGWSVPTATRCTRCGHYDHAGKWITAWSLSETSATLTPKYFTSHVVGKPRGTNQLLAQRHDCQRQSQQFCKKETTTVRKGAYYFFLSFLFCFRDHICMNEVSKLSLSTASHVLFLGQWQYYSNNLYTVQVQWLIKTL